MQGHGNICEGDEQRLTLGLAVCVIHSTPKEGPPHTKPLCVLGPPAYCSCCLECTHSSFSPYWIFLFTQLKKMSSGRPSGATLFKVVSSSDHPLPQRISFLVLITLAGIVFERSPGSLSVSPLASELLEGKGCVLYIIPVKPRPVPRWDLQIFE